MSNHQQILNEFMDKYPHWNMQCNVQPLFDAAARPLSVANLEAAAERIQLAMPPEFTETLHEFYTKYPQFKCDGNTSVLLSLWSGHFITLAAFEEVAQRTPCPLTVNAEYRAAAQEQKCRSQLIETIANGSTQYKRFSKAQGAFRYFSVADLSRLPTEELQEIANEVSEARRVGDLSAQELRAQVRASEAAAQQNTTDVFLAHPGHPEREYTATELKRLSREQYRRILCFPNGQSRGPQFAAAITRILRAGN